MMQKGLDERKRNIEAQGIFNRHIPDQKKFIRQDSRLRHKRKSRPRHDW